VDAGFETGGVDEAGLEGGGVDEPGLEGGGVLLPAFFRMPGPGLPAAGDLAGAGDLEGVPPVLRNIPGLGAGEDA